MLPCHFHISVCLQIRDFDRRVRDKNAGFFAEMLSKAIEHFFTNECRKIQAAIGEYDEILILLKNWKLRWFGQVSRSSGLDSSAGHSES